MLDMLKTVLLDAFGLRPAPGGAAAVPAPAPQQEAPVNAQDTQPTGYPLYDSTGMVSVTEDHFGIL